MRESCELVREMSQEARYENAAASGSEGSNECAESIETWPLFNVIQKDRSLCSSLGSSTSENPFCNSARLAGMSGL
jgi:hypothetical protein